MTILKWSENYYLSLSLPLSHTHTHSCTHNKRPHLPRKHLSKTGMANFDTTWLVLCISIAFCSYGPQPMSNRHLRINSHYYVSSRKPSFHHTDLSSWDRPGVERLNLCPWFILCRTVKCDTILLCCFFNWVIISLTKYIYFLAEWSDAQ